MSSQSLNLSSSPVSPAVPAFLHKLRLLVDSEMTNDLIYWDDSGKSFHICDGNRLAKEILPLYFKHNNLSSFIRQLNMYGFRKVNRNDTAMGFKLDMEDLEFSHPYFERDKEHLLVKIHRKPPNLGSFGGLLREPTLGGGGVSDTKPSYVLSPTNNLSTSGNRLVTSDEFSRLVDVVKQMKSRQEATNQQLSQLKSDNQLLYREMADLRAQHEKQAQVIQSIFQFLSACVVNDARRPTLVSGLGVGPAKRKLPLPIMPGPASTSVFNSSPTLVSTVPLTTAPPASSAPSELAPPIKLPRIYVTSNNNNNATTAANSGATRVRIVPAILPSSQQPQQQQTPMLTSVLTRPVTLVSGNPVLANGNSQQTKPATVVQLVNPVKTEAVPVQRNAASDLKLLYLYEPSAVSTTLSASEFQQPQQQHPTDNNLDWTATGATDAEALPLIDQLDDMAVTSTDLSQSHVDYNSRLQAVTDSVNSFGAELSGLQQLLEQHRTTSQNPDVTNTLCSFFNVATPPMTDDDETAAATAAGVESPLLWDHGLEFDEGHQGGDTSAVSEDELQKLDPNVIRGHELIPLDSATWQWQPCVSLATPTNSNGKKKGSTIDVSTARSPADPMMASEDADIEFLSQSEPSVTQDDGHGVNATANNAADLEFDLLTPTASLSDDLLINSFLAESPRKAVFPGSGPQLLAPSYTAPTNRTAKRQLSQKSASSLRFVR